MKKTGNALLSVLLCILLTLSALTPAFAAERSGKDIPCVHIHGQSGDIINAAGEVVSNKEELPEGGLANMLKERAPLILTALKEDTEEAWDACRDELIPMVLSLFGPMWLDNNGEPKDGTHLAWDWDRGHLTDNKTADGYDLESYPFYMDWRLDPFAVADTLHEYIQDIKAATGSDKVNISARCEGSVMLAAYLAKYGCGDCHCLEFSDAAVYGADLAGVVFSGHFQVDLDALKLYNEHKHLITDDVTLDFINALFEFLNDTFVMGVADVSLDLLLGKLYDEIVVPLVRQTYGTMPSFWALVGAEDYPAARKNIFKGCEDEYAGLIEKIERYDREVRQMLDALLRGARDAGAKIAVFAKYSDFPLPTLGKNSRALSDNLIALKSTSMGATSADYGSVLSKRYLEKAQKNGTDRYISPDKMVDASTCLLPDTTWIFYGLYHADLPDALVNLMMRFYAFDGDLTVFDDPSFPQFMIAPTDANGETTGTLEPMTAENAPVIEAEKPKIRNVDWKDLLLRFFKAALALFRQWLKSE